MRICARNTRAEIQKEEFIPEGGTVRCVAKGAGADGMDVVGTRPIQREFGLENLGIRAGLCALANSGGRITRPNPITHK